MYIDYMILIGTYMYTLIGTYMYTLIGTYMYVHTYIDLDKELTDNG